MTDTAMIDRLKQFVESEMRSCSMDIGGITPLTFTGCGEEERAQENQELNDI